MKRTVLLLLIFTSIKLFASSIPEKEKKDDLHQYFDKYIIGDMPKEIRSENLRKEYNVLGNGLFRIDWTMSYSDGRQVKRSLICYNEYYNNTIISDFKLNETIEILDVTSNPSMKDIQFTIVKEENRIIIEYKYLLEINNENNRGYDTHKVLLLFDEFTKKLKRYQITSQYPIGKYYTPIAGETEITEKKEYEYCYNNEGRLDKIYLIIGENKIEIKSYYYDGELRLLVKPYFNDLELPTLEEIVIYDNKTLKYHVQLRPLDIRPGPISPQDVQTRDNQHYYTLFEFDINGNEIKQIKYYGKNELYPRDNEMEIFNTKILGIDDFLNWSHIIIDHENDPENSEEIIRTIIY
ncbi:hypothetical protein [Breznakiella homolactica]|uniref:MucB/RseB N-terminal domain-containing protein n=1 Tax=Breznakiella homolactica TaxID=2798577 RepID=A0A7T7XJP1_9SPIR|nr:hypothetical protein [Breznakiella homolactica]QQO07659.1 hypothetical protein JFL75_11955 [Breznakiella homolactica]